MRSGRTADEWLYVLTAVCRAARGVGLGSLVVPDPLKREWAQR